MVEKTEAMKELTYHAVPRNIAEKLKRGQPKEAFTKVYENVTILSAVINNVCTLSKFMQPQELLEIIKRIMEEIDGLIRIYHGCKFESAGDACIVVTGLPTPTELHAALIAELAFDLILAMKNINASTPSLAGGVSIQIGCHSGTVLAGVIDRGVASYQAYGEDITIAQRLQQEGQVLLVLIGIYKQCSVAAFFVLIHSCTDCLFLVPF
ncbi:unnamed protein product [Schistocephalus solidus]|uniref:Guanylate cyclase domain-containing protein n=1 Tax=Schistocephalus solidus TaxID=70667 RepID=A0A3P7DBJ4_SCHSO|nr:unnamed protein product [Schistocephalus solidus]